MAASLDSFPFGDAVDKPTFEQILDMDDEDDDSHEFSRGIVFGFFEQAESTFLKMDAAMAEKNLEELASLGHFLKGSSATLGFRILKDECEKIQHYGQKKDETGTIDEPDSDKCLRLIGICIKKAKIGYREVEQLMRQFFDEI